MSSLLEFKKLMEWQKKKKKMEAMQEFFTIVRHVSFEHNFFNTLAKNTISLRYFIDLLESALLTNTVTTFDCILPFTNYDSLHFQHSHLTPNAIDDLISIN